MSPLSWPVVIGTLLVGSPALWAAQVAGTLSPDVALIRLLVCAVGVWVTVSLVVELAKGTARTNAVHLEETTVLEPGADDPDKP